jgi:hypothetical protein
VTPSAPGPEEELGTVTPMTIHDNNDRQARPVLIPSAPSIEVTDSSASAPTYDGKYQMKKYVLGTYYWK